MGNIPEKDGIVANLSILEAMAYENKPLYQIVKELKEEIGGPFVNKRLDLRLTEEVKHVALKMFAQSPPSTLGNMKIKEICRKDGVKFYFDDNNSWILIRPSGTEPVFRVYFETDSEEKLKKLIDDTKRLIDDLSVKV